MKKCRRYWWMVLALIGCLAGCGEKEAPLQTEAGDSLKIYMVSEDGRYEACIESFQKDYPEIMVDLVLFNSQEELANQYANDVGIGTTPDVLLLTDDTTIDIYKAIKNDCFVDMKPYFDLDDSFVMEAYFEAAFEAGQYEDKQFVVPLGLNVYTCTVRNSAGQVLPIDNMENLTGREIMNTFMQMEGNSASVENGIEVIAFDMNMDAVRNILRSSTVHFIELGDKDLSLEKGDIEQLFQYTKFIWSQQEKANVARSQATSQEDMLKKVAYGYLEKNPIFDIRTSEQMYYTVFGDAVNSYLIPTLDDAGHYEGIVVNYGVVDANSSNVKGAYDFLRYALDYSDYTNCQHSLYVNKDNGKMLRTEIAESIVLKKADGSTLLIPEMTEENYDLLEDMFNNLDKAYLPNRTVEEIYFTVFDDYVSEEKDFDECFEELQKRLKIYWNE